MLRAGRAVCAAGTHAVRGGADGISPLARNDAMTALNGTALQPNDAETFASAKTCMSGTVQQKIKCWGDTKRTVWATAVNGPVGNEYP
jgi:hypothetical protein